MTQKNLESILMMQLFENEVKVRVDMLIHFHVLEHVSMMQEKKLVVEQTQQMMLLSEQMLLGQLLVQRLDF